MRLILIDPTGLDVMTRQKKARPIIVKFARYNVRGRVFGKNRN